MSGQAWRVSWAVCALAVLPAQAMPQASVPPAIVVSGSAQLRVPADSATFRVTWYLRNGEPEAQRTEDAAALDSLRGLLRKAGARDVALRHAGDEWYDFLVPSKDESTAHERRRQASFDILGEAPIASALVGLRNHPIFKEVQPSYGCTCADSVRALALAMAFERTRRTATALAGAGGMRLTGITMVSTQPLALGSGVGLAVEHDGRALDETMLFLRPAGYSTVAAPLAAPFVTVDAMVFVVWQVERR